MKYNEHKKYFETAYKNGSDYWTHLPNQMRGLKLLEKLPPNSLILDVGSGRGLFGKRMAEAGFRVIGIDFEPNIVQKSNADIKSWGLEGKLKFMEADALDIPLADNSFDGVCDFGILDNLFQEDWEIYANEITRVLKPGGFFLNLSLSKENHNFFDFNPKGSPTGNLDKYGIHYHFFTKDEMLNVFKDKLKLISQNLDIIQKPHETIMLESFFQK